MRMRTSPIRPLLLLVVLLAVIAAACGGDDEPSGVATLRDTTTTAPQASGGAIDEEQALLAFSQCLRDNGVDIGDPIVDADGNVTLDFASVDVDQIDQDTLIAARDACIDLLEGVSFGFEPQDFTELQDTLLEFAQCMRSNGFDLPDPDFSRILSGEVGPDAGPFGQIDFNDPTFQTALEACGDILAGFAPGGGG